MKTAIFFLLVLVGCVRGYEDSFFRRSADESDIIVPMNRGEKVASSSVSPSDSRRAKMPDNIGTSEETASSAPTLPWIPTGIVMSDGSIISMDHLWTSLELLWKQKGGENDEEDGIIPVAIIMKNGDTVPLENFWSLMGKIFSREKKTDEIPKFKAIPAMTRNKEGVLVYPDGSPVPLPSKDDLEWPVVGWRQEENEGYTISLINHEGKVSEVEVSKEDFKNLLDGKNVSLSSSDDKDNLVGAQFAGGYGMYGYPGTFGCPYYSPCSPMYNGMGRGGMYGGHRQNHHFYMSSGSSSSSSGGMYGYPHSYW